MTDQAKLRIAYGFAGFNILALLLHIWALVIAYQTGNWFFGFVTLCGLVGPLLTPQTSPQSFFCAIPFLLFWSWWGGTFAWVAIPFVIIGLIYYFTMKAIDKSPITF